MRFILLKLQTKFYFEDLEVTGFIGFDQQCSQNAVRETIHKLVEVLEKKFMNELEQ